MKDLQTQQDLNETLNETVNTTFSQEEELNKKRFWKLFDE